MNYTQQLIDSLSDSEKATQVLDAHPEAARGTGNHGESPLLMAVYMGNEPLARRIAGMRPTDIHEAAALGDASRVEKLLDVNPEHIGSMSSDGWTPLHLAAFFGRREVLANLLDRGADTEKLSQNSTGNTALCAALAGKTDTESVRLLLARGASAAACVEAGITPLHIAASRGADDLVRLLVEHGADPAAKMNDGTSPAEMARKRGHEETAKLIESLVTT
jgi:uncharacterized protein